MLIVITYDLNRIKDYKKLYTAIQTLGVTKRDSGLDSVWFVDTDYTPIDIQNYFLGAKIIDKDDRVFISALIHEGIAGYLQSEVVDWIHQRV